MADPIREAIHAWIREDVPLAGKMNLMPKHVEALIAKIAALRPPQGDEAEAMREAAAFLVGLRANGYAFAVDTDREQRGDAEAAIALTMAAEAIRSLPLPQHSLTKNQGGENAS